MGKKKFNAKARNQQSIQIDNSETRKIRLDIIDGPVKTDDSNALVLPSQKRPTKVKADQVQVTRILSKKQRKRLEKIVDQKKKKENRASLIEALASVQVTKAQLSSYASISSIQTKGLKRLKQEKNRKPREVAVDADLGGPVLSKGGHKRKRLELLEESSSEDEEERVRDYNVVGLEESSEEEEDELKVKKTPKVEEKKVETPKKVEPEPKKAKVEVPIDRKPATYIHVERDSKIQAARLKLPILAEEQVVMETISDNHVVIIAGETGSGKTTQVPQFLYEAGYAEKKMIGVTEPRRVAAISMSKRVAREMNLGPDVISYLMRFEGNVTDRTKVKFMTDGVLLKEVESDFLLRKYSVIILDEAHERSVFTDILVGLLSRIVILRDKEHDPLKLIIMSATLRVEDFTANKILFKVPPPVLKVESRQFPVTIHFNRVTAADYVKEAYNKAVKIHTKLPEGGILIFLTGQKEVKKLVTRLRKAFPYKRGQDTEAKTTTEEESFDEEDWDTVRAKKKKLRKKQRKELPKIKLDAYKLPSEAAAVEDDEESDSMDDGEEDDDETEAKIEGKIFQPFWVLPLYSVLSSEKQALVFEEPPAGTRLCVVATNIAETSITIPNIKYVVDSGRQKSKVYDKVTGVSAFTVTFTSKASADQRAGRAGRVGPGHCYRLYSSAVFKDDFQAFSTPEIQEKPVEDLMLQMKVIGVEKVDRFPFPSPPDAVQLEVAERKLKMLGALETKTYLKGNKTEEVVEITEIGRTIARFPVNPRFGKMLALSNQANLLPYVVSLVAAMSVPNVLEEGGVHEGDDAEVKKEESQKFREIRHNWAGDGESCLLGDPMVLLRAILASLSHSNLEQFCESHGLRPKAVHEILKIRQQVTNDINLNAVDVNVCIDPSLAAPNDIQIKLLRQILLSGYGDQVARKMTKQEINAMPDKKRFRNAYHCIDMEDPVFLHQESVLKYEDPEWVIYSEAYEVTMEDGKQKMFLRGITAIDPTWLPQFVPQLCNVLRVLDTPEPRYDAARDEVLCHVNATFSKAAWQIPPVEVPMEVSVDLYKWFARFLLAGDVLSGLEEFRDDLLSSPESMVKTWSKLLPRTKNLLDSLMEKEIYTKKRLLKAWKKEKNYLLEEYKLWLPEHQHFNLKKKWPPIE